MQPRPEDALHVFPYQVSEAAFLNGPDRTLFLFLLETTAAGLRVLQLSRAEGFRGQEVRNSNLVKHSISGPISGAMESGSKPDTWSGTFHPGSQLCPVKVAGGKFFPSKYQLSVRWHPMDAILKPDI